MLQRLSIQGRFYFNSTLVPVLPCHGIWKQMQISGDSLSGTGKCQMQMDDRDFCSHMSITPRKTV